jgi:Protein of unknown function (DUF3014)
VADIGNYRLQRTANPRRDDFPDERSPFPWGLVGMVVLAIAILGGGGYYWLQRGKTAPAAPPAKSAASTAPADASRSPLGGTPESVEVPPLGQSDPLVRLLVQSMSSHPRVLAWLATDGLIRNFTVVVGNIAEGRTPARHLGMLKPAGRFKTVTGATGLNIDPSSYSRYDDLAAAVGTLDPQAAARVYATLKPRIEEAQGELGSQQPFDATLEEAIVRLVQTPATIDPRLFAKCAEGYRYVDDRLESLDDAQKLLLRMGPSNAQIVRNKLKEIGLALGIPAARLGG